MHHATPPTIDSATPEKPIARIDTADEQFASPIREFLTAHYCDVTVNDPSSHRSTYHIVCGDREFVEAIYEKAPDRSQKRIALVWNVIPEEVVDETGFYGSKVVLVDGMPLDSRAIEDIFAFFFTSSEMLLDLRSSNGAKSTVPFVARVGSIDAAETNLTVAQQSDHQRVSNIIADVFGVQEGKPVLEYHGKGAVSASRLHTKGKHGSHEAAVPSSPQVWAKRCAVFLLLCVLPFFLYGASIALAVAAYGYAAQALTRGNEAMARRATDIGTFWVSQARSMLVSARPIGAVMYLDQPMRTNERFISLLSDIGESQRSIVDIGQDGKQLGKALFPSAPSDVSKSSPIATIDAMRIKLTVVNERIGLARAELTRLMEENARGFARLTVEKLGQPVIARLDRVHEATTTLANLLALYRQTGGFSEKKTYLLLLQNNMELRPTGGFIGSIGLATLSDGKLSDLAIHDVYALDGQLRGHVPPPDPIKELLGQEHWYLRDSNWDPDFRPSAQKAAWFYEKETGVAVDGVIGITTAILTDILRATGPIELTDYNDRISAENFFGKSLYYTQTGFFPGSTQKKDFLGSLTTALLTRLTVGTGVSQFALFETLIRGLSRRDLIFNFADLETQAMAERYGWAGRAPLVPRCVSLGTDPCVHDFAYVVEANMAVNKANYFLKRSRIHQIIFRDDGAAAETVTLTYRNTTPATNASSGGGGSYRGFVRWLLPLGAVVSSVTIDGTALPTKDTRAKIGSDVPYVTGENTTGEYVAVGAAFDVPVGAQVKLAISYEQPGLISFNSGRAVYELLIQKQPGMTEEDVRIEIRHPVFWVPTAETSQSGPLFPTSTRFLANEGSVEYNTTMTHDRTVRILFEK